MENEETFELANSVDLSNPSQFDNLSQVMPTEVDEKQQKPQQLPEIEDSDSLQSSSESDDHNESVLICQKCKGSKIRRGNPCEACEGAGFLKHRLDSLIEPYILDKVVPSMTEIFKQKMLNSISSIKMSPTERKQSYTFKVLATNFGDNYVVPGRQKLTKIWKLKNDGS